MSMVVGLHSGKEFLVMDESYILYPDSGMVHIFRSLDGKRRITVNHPDIEYFDEVSTPDREKQLLTLALVKPEPEAAGVDYV